MKKVLCIVPLYNKIQFLPYSIGSVLNQEGIDITMVIVDDCSTDGSLEWVKEYTKGMDNVHILENEENIGCYQSRNRGLQYAISNEIDFDFYTVTDPDDQQVPGRFALIVDAFEKTSYNIIKQTHYRYNIDTKKTIEQSDAGEGAAWFRKEVFDVLGYWDNTLRMSGDTEYITRYMNYWKLQNIDFSKKVGLQTQPLVYCLTDNTGQNLTSLYPASSPERMVVFYYIDSFTENVTQITQCWYEYDNLGHTFTSMGTVA